MKTKFHTMAVSLVAGALSLALTPFAQSAETVHIHQTFESMPLGAISTGGGWGVSGGTTATVVNSPVFEGAQALQLTRSGSGSLTYGSNGTGNTSLILANNSSYQWSLAFRLDSETIASSTAGTYVWLDTGSNSRTFAGLRVHYNTTEAAFQLSYFSDLDASVTAAASYTLLGSISTDQWYEANFDISVNSTGLISQDIQIGSFSASITDQANTAFNAGTTHVRVAISPQVDGSLMQYDNLYLATIPEPGTAACLLIGLAATPLFFRKRK